MSGDALEYAAVPDWVRPTLLTQQRDDARDLACALEQELAWVAQRVRALLDDPWGGGTPGASEDLHFWLAGEAP